MSAGRCPACGAAVNVRLRPDEPGEIAPHPCGSRACEYEACPTRRDMAEMIELSSGEWYCPPHALLALARELVALTWLSGPDSESGAAEIVKLVSETLPGIVEKITEDERRNRWPRPTA